MWKDKKNVSRGGLTFVGNYESLRLVVEYSCLEIVVSRYLALQVMLILAYDKDVSAFVQESVSYLVQVFLSLAYGLW